MSSLPPTTDALDPELRAVGFDAVEFAATLADGSDRLVTVLIGSGPSWRRAVRFPNVGSEGGQSLGDEALDDQVRRRASEELVCLAAALRAIDWRAA